MCNHRLLIFLSLDPFASARRAFQPGVNFPRDHLKFVHARSSTGNRRSRSRSRDRECSTIPTPSEIDASRTPPCESAVE